MAPISRGLMGRRHPVDDPARIPPGQYLTPDFPVLSAGPTPHTPLEQWSFEIQRSGSRQPVSWSWGQFLDLPAEAPTVDIHCVTKWSKLDTSWKGVSVDTRWKAVVTDADVSDGLLRRRKHDQPGRSTTSPASARGSRTSSGARRSEPEHGGPAWLPVPHLYFWKSAKWVRGVTADPGRRAGFLGALRL